MNLYLLMTALFVGLAIVGALDASLVSYTFLADFVGLRWLRVHLVTLGAMTEALFGVLPLVVALRYRLPRPRFRWLTWLLLNGGLLLLLVGIPSINKPLIFMGGTFVFLAALLLIDQLRQLRPAAARGITDDQSLSGQKFYVMGLIYLLLGILIGTGIWLGWSRWLHINAAVEVHIHANNWGFLSLVFAGLLVDMLPVWTGRPLAWAKAVNPIFYLMTLGALGLILGPWFSLSIFTVPGLILHLSGTVWLLVNVGRTVNSQANGWRTPGPWHLVTAYFWILAPIAVAPFVLLGVPGFPAGPIEQNAPQALVYGWVFQFAFALLPYFFQRLLLPDVSPHLGGSWWSLILIHLGGVSLWASIFITTWQGVLHGTAYVLWAAAIFPIFLDIWGTIRRGLRRIEDADDQFGQAGLSAGD